MQVREHTYISPDMQTINSLHTHAIIIDTIIILCRTLLSRISNLHRRLTQQLYIISLPIARHGYDNENHQPSVDESGVQRTLTSRHQQYHSRRPHMRPQPSRGLFPYPFHSWTGIGKIAHLNPFPIMADLLPNRLSHLSSEPRRSSLLRAQLQLIRS